MLSGSRFLSFAVLSVAWLDFGPTRGIATNYTVYAIERGSPDWQFQASWNDGLDGVKYPGSKTARQIAEEFAQELLQRPNIVKTRIVTETSPYNPKPNEQGTTNALSDKKESRENSKTPR